MNHLLNISPVLPVQSLENEVEFFKKLGFNSVYDSLHYSEDLDYIVLNRDQQSIHLQLFESGDFSGQQIKIWVSNIEILDEQLKSTDLVVFRNFNTPWNTHELGMYSPSNHAVFFVQEIS